MELQRDTWPLLCSGPAVRPSGSSAGLFLARALTNPNERTARGGVAPSAPQGRGRARPCRLGDPLPQGPKLLVIEPPDLGRRFGRLAPQAQDEEALHVHGVRQLVDRDTL